MQIFMITTVKTTTSEPYTQLLRDRIELQPTPAGMIFLPNTAVLQTKYPNFWKMLLAQEMHLRADPTQLDPPLLATLRHKIGVRLETDDIPQAAALLNLSEEDSIFKGKHTQTKT
jgi:hypothetical protein